MLWITQYLLVLGSLSGVLLPSCQSWSKLHFLTLFHEIYSNLSLNLTTYHCKAELSGWPGETISVGCILHYYKINATCTAIPLVILFTLKFYLPREFFFKKKCLSRQSLTEQHRSFPLSVKLELPNERVGWKSSCAPQIS